MEVSYTERIVKMEKDIEYIKESQYKQDAKLDKLMDSIERLDSKLDNHMIDETEYLDKKFKENESKFANKTTEHIVNGLVITILLAVLGAILKFIILT